MSDSSILQDTTLSSINIGTDSNLEQQTSLELARELESSDEFIRLILSSDNQYINEVKEEIEEVDNIQLKPIIGKNDDYIIRSYDIELTSATETDIDRRRVYDKSVEFSLEEWWLVSPPWRRGPVLMLFLLAIITLLHISAAIILPFLKTEVEDPYTCKTDSCKVVSTWITSSMNKEIKPCDDFYQFVCGNYNDIEANQFTKSELDLNLIPMDYQSKSIFGKVLKRSNHPVLRKVLMNYQSCLEIQHRDSTELKNIIIDLDLHPDKSTGLTLEEIAYNLYSYTGDFGLFRFKLYIDRYNLDKRKFRPDYVRYKENYADENYLDMFIELGKILELRTVTATKLNQLFSVIRYGLVDIKRMAIREYYQFMKDGTWNENSGNLDNSTKGPFNVEKVLQALDPDILKSTGNVVHTAIFDMTNFLITDQPAKSYNAYYICKGFLNYYIKDLPDNDKILAYKAVWLINMFTTYVEQLPMDVSNKFGQSRISRTRDENGGKLTSSIEEQCFADLTEVLAVPLNERLRLSLNISPDSVENMMTNLVVPEAMELRHWTRRDKEYKKYKRFGRILMKLSHTVSLDWHRMNDPRYLDDALLFFGYDVDLTEHKYLQNHITLTKLYNDNELKAWLDSDIFVLWRSGEELAFNEIVNLPQLMRPSNTVKRLIGVPLVLYHTPFLGNEIAVLDYAGTWNFIFSAITFQWKLHQHRGAPHYGGRDLTDIEILALAAENEMYKLNECTWFKGNKHARTNVFDFINEPAFHEALGMHLTFNLYRLNYTLDLSVAQLKYKRLIGLEEYSLDELFFIKAIRHQCRSDWKAAVNADGTATDRILNYIVNVPEFAEVWNCPPDTKMGIDNICSARKEL